MSVASRGVLILTTLLLVAGCGGGGRGGGDDGGEDLPTGVEVSSEDERVAHPLAGGRYRIQFRAPDCEEPTIQITEDGGQGFTFTKEDPTTRIFFAHGLPNGSFFIEILNCEEWSIKLSQI